ncbi:MAG: hypothetical protein U5K84_09865 [Alkalibacterium sp.]|nr:hypothetical protein [Alkalibacterium sp.]
MAELKHLLNEKPWAREYLYFDPDLKEDDVVYDDNLTKFSFFIQAMEEVEENKQELLKWYNLPEHQRIKDLLSVFKVMNTYGKATAEQRELFFDMLSAHVNTETVKGRTLDDIFEDKDALALARLYQVTDEKWTEKYMTWVLFELGAVEVLPKVLTSSVPTKAPSQPGTS